MVVVIAIMHKPNAPPGQKASEKMRMQIEIHMDERKDLSWAAERIRLAIMSAWGVDGSATHAERMVLDDEGNAIGGLYLDQYVQSEEYMVVIAGSWARDQSFEEALLRALVAAGTHTPLTARNMVVYRGRPDPCWYVDGGGNVHYTNQRRVTRKEVEELLDDEDLQRRIKLLQQHDLVGDMWDTLDTLSRISLN